MVFGFLKKNGPFLVENSNLTITQITLLRFIRPPLEWVPDIRIFKKFRRILSLLLEKKYEKSFLEHRLIFEGDFLANPYLNSMSSQP